MESGFPIIGVRGLIYVDNFSRESQTIIDSGMLNGRIEDLGHSVSHIQGRDYGKIGKITFSVVIPSLFGVL